VEISVRLQVRVVIATGAALSGYGVSRLCTVSFNGG